jgi:hypothetical protein
MNLLTTPRGNSETALYLDKASKEISKYFDGSATLSKRTAYNDLVKIWNECNTPNWDGYDAYPVERSTLQNANLFISSLPLNYPLPSLGVEPDGHLTLEWYRHPRWTISISISPEGMIYYAALFANSDVRGSEFFSGGISGNLFDLIQRVNIVT